MEAGPEPLVEVAWALIQTLPVNTRIHEELESMGGRCEMIVDYGVNLRKGMRVLMKVQGKDMCSWR